MASTAHKTKEELEEHFDSAEVLQEKVNKLVKLIKQSKHFVAFTGAGMTCKFFFETTEFSMIFSFQEYLHQLESQILEAQMVNFCFLRKFSKHFF